VKSGIDAEMQTKRPSAKPDATTFHKVGGLPFLDQSQHAAVEGARNRFLARRHGQLYVIESDNLRQYGYSSIGRAIP